VPQGSFKSGITTRNFQISVADSGKRHPDQRFAITGRLHDLCESELLVFIAKRFHFGMRRLGAAL
jgi:hypothetical protein